MKHNILLDNLGPNGEMMAGAVEKCVHCGFCLASCPTYTVLNEEMDSPRGRIILMKNVLEGELELDEALPYIDRCLGCLSCVSACPSGVPYDELLVPFRGYAETRRERPLVERIARRLTRESLPYPVRFRLAAGLGKAVKPAATILPDRFQAMLEMLPEDLPSTQPLPGVYRAEGKPRARVALLVGCVQQAIEPEINWASLRVLARNGVEVIIPADQGCCGGLALHTGDLETARRFGLANLRAFSADVDAILTNAAGCGSSLHDYPLLFKGTRLEAQARSLAERSVDISVFLDRLGFQGPPDLPQPVKVAYHDACHLAHAQGVTAEPRSLLQTIPNLTLAAVAEADLCCGSAGTYNLDQPEIATALGGRKAENLRATGAQLVLTGNIGCLVQLRRHLSSNGRRALPVWHLIEFLDKAYVGFSLD
jgi:glycolate oxidase iron-sulfur subunit